MMKTLSLLVGLLGFVFMMEMSPVGIVLFFSMMVLSMILWDSDTTK